MAASEIKEKYGTPTALTITLANLASSTGKVGRQSTLVNNGTTGFEKVHVFVTLQTGTTSFAAGYATPYLIKGDGTHRTDGAGADDAGITLVNARPLESLILAAANTTYVLDFVVQDPGPEWGIAIVHNTVAALQSGSIYFVGDNPEAQ